jgi:hypothetical protein
LSLFINYLDVTSVLFDFDFKHFLGDCPLELVKIDIDPIRQYKIDIISSTYFTLASSSIQEYLVIFLAGFCYSASLLVSL